MSTNCVDIARATPEFAATWIENWPKAVQRLSFRQCGIRLSLEQAHALGRRNGVFAHGFVEGLGDSLSRLEAVLDAEFADFPSGAFVRLGSRSAKDTPTAILTGCRAQSGREAIELLTGHSRRVAFDLRLCIRHGYQPWIFLREWHDFDWFAEFRCFLFEGQLAGISQYHYGAVLTAAFNELQIARVKEAAEGMALALRHALGKISVVFDIYLTGHLQPVATLIELNPWGAPTDACLFSWEKGDFDGTLRIQDKPGESITARNIATDSWLFSKLASPVMRGWGELRQE